MGDEPAVRRGDPPPAAVMGLLTYLTVTALDEGYAHVARERGSADGADDGSGPGARRRRGRPGLTALLVLALFGALVATAAVSTSRNSAQSASSHDSLVGQVKQRRAELARRLATEQDLRREVAARQRADLSETAQGRAAQTRLTRLGVVSGGVSTRGPGVVAVLDDAPGTTDARLQVQARDLQKLVNGLWLVGAEAISINGHRLTSLTPIRDAAEAVTVDFISLKRPYVVSAIGDTRTMGAALLDTEGGQEMLTLESLGLQFHVDTEDSMLLPAARRTALHYAQQPERRR